MRTRQALHEALFALIQKRGYDAITVEDICARAGVGRSTFYAHYTDKDDLKRSGLKMLRQELAGCTHETGGSDRPLAFSPALLEHARRHLDHYRAMIGSRGSAISLEVLREVLTDLVRREAGIRLTDGPARDTAIAFIVGGYMAALIHWLDGGARQAPEEIDALLRRIATAGWS